MSILGRDSELARVESQLESLPSGPVRLLLEGEAGIGKTTLLQAALASARARGYRVLASRPAEAERSLAWTGLVDLLEPVPPEVLATLPEPQREALEVALLRRAAGAHPPDPRAVFTAFVNVGAALAAESPLVVAVDDLQWLDPPSTRALEFFGRRVTSPGIAIVAATRVAGDGAVPPAALWFAPDERLRLAPLSAAALHRLIREQLDVNLPRQSVIRLHRLCAGNAFHALEIAQRLTALGLADARGDWPLPPDVHELVRSRVEALGDDARHELVLAAAAAQPTSELVGPTTLAAAEGAGLIRRTSGRLEFVHPLYAEAVYATASPEERRRAHAQLAKREPDRAERARHLGLTVDGADPDVAAELEAAAGHARSRGAYETAGELLERAIELTPDDDEGACDRRLLAAATDWLGAGALARTRELLGRIGQEGDGRLQAQALRLLALVHFREQSVPQAMPLLERSAAVAGDAYDVRALAELELAFLSVNVSFDFEAAGPHADRALEYAARAGDDGVLAQALAVKAIAGFLLGHGLDRDIADRALELEHACAFDVPAELRPSLIVGSLALYEGDISRALELLEGLAQQMREQGLEADLPFLLCVISWAGSWGGRLAEARASNIQALDLAALTGSDSLVGYSHANAALTDAHAGDEAGCREHVAQALADMERTGYVIHATWSLSALGMLELSRGDATAAAQTLQPLIEVFEQSPPPEPVRGFFVPDAVEALVGAGQLERAARMNDVFTALAVSHDRTWSIGAAARGRALIDAAHGDIDAARTAAESSVTLARSGQMPLELARSLLVLGQIERRAKQKAAARAALEEAAAVCEGIGALLWAERARDELGRLGSAVKLDALSATEERISQLAASGLTNREIARAVFVSEKTVEANLSRVYRKLGVRSRTELARLLAQPDEQGLPVP